jgi:glycerol-3-phosphate dehydrogenase (NAD(P)+)
MVSTPSSNLTVLGAGAWGTTLSWMLASQGHAVRLWCLEPDLAEELRVTRRNGRYRPELELPQNVQVDTDMAAALAGAEVVVVAAPSRFVRGVLEQARPHLTGRPLLLSASKGLEESTGLRMSQVIREVLPADLPLAALSGPNLSKEIALGMPTVSVAAAPDEAVAARAQQLLTTSLFRVYRNCDIIGVELCGALKNVIAIGAGVSEGLGFGANAKAALVTRGLAEMARLGTHLGAQPATFWGAAGVGDLVATCHSHDSRNWNVGWRLAQGETWEQIDRGSISVAEGVYTAQAARRLGDQHGIPLPITEATCQVLFEGVPVRRAVELLMTRPEKAEEDWGYSR